MENVTEYAKILAISTNREIGKELYGAQKIAENISYILEYSEFTEKELLGSLKNIVEKNDEIYGCGISFEPYFFDKTKYYYDHYFYKSDSVVKYLNRDNQSKKEYDYFKWDWYTTPKKLNKGVWGEPYYDEGGGNILMVTYSEPFYKTINGKREFCGVVACDVDLNWLEKFVTDIKIFETGYAFILSSKGVYIEHKNKDYISLKKTIFSVANEFGNVKMKELGEKMISNQTGFVEYYSYILRKKCFVSYAPLKEAGWSIGIVIPEDELFSDLNTLTLKLFIMGFFGYILTLMLIITLASRITIPLRTLASVTNEIGEGDFNAKLPSISSTDEIGVLSRSFHSMQENLIKYIANLQETTAAKEKIEKELSIAREIQQSLLPHKFPCLKQIDLYATLIPAKEVGGDLYDFFFIDEKHLCFAIGDVSGKGVPAALFMAVTRTLLRAKLSITMDPAKVFNAMNQDLCNEKESYMFVTFFLGIFNIETGLLEYCNAGHTPPLIHTAHKGFYYFHTEAPHPPLGIMADVNYVGNRLKLLPEDLFFLYTDGVTEAMNIDYIQFSEEKLLDILVQNKNETLLNIVNNVKMAIELHASGAVQSDDIAMLIFKYNG
jgi:sigma-B regulation protein RsbU (phosphoserine phosphatase)